MSDPNINNVELFLDFNGADTDSFTRDKSYNNWAVTRVDGAVIDNAQSKHGGTSSLFDGSGDAWTVYDNNDGTFDLSGDFTIEGYVRFNTVPGAATYKAIASHRVRNGAFSDNGWAIFYEGTDKWQLWYYDGTSYDGVVDINSTVPSTGQWYHFALVRDGTNLDMYIDGVKGTTKTLTDTINYPDSLLVVGAARTDATTYGSGFDGWIDDFRITNGIARYTANFDPPGPLSAVAGDPFFAATSAVLNFDGTDGDTTYTDLSPVGTNVNISAVELDDANLLFGKTTVLLGGNTGTYGTGDYVYLSDSSNAFGTNENFTIEGWFYLDALGKALFGKRTGTWGYYVNVSATGVLSWNARIGASLYEGDRITSAASAVSTATWHHVALSRIGTTYYLHLDGALVGSEVETGALYDHASHDFIFGGSDSTGTSDNYTGHLGPCRITRDIARYGDGAFDKPSAPFPLDPYNTYDADYDSVEILISGEGFDTDNNIYDYSSNNAAITVTGDPAFDDRQSRWGNTGITFGGSSDYLKLPSAAAYVPESQDFTIEAWIRLDVIDPGPNTIYSCGDNNTSTGFLFNVKYFSGNARLQVFTNNTNICSGEAGPDTISTNTWHHVALTRSGSTWRTYIDGKYQQTGTNSVNFNSNTRTYIGTRYYNGGLADDFDGFMDGFRFTKGVARYTGATDFTPPSEPFGASLPPPVEADLLSNALTITGGDLDTVFTREALVTSNALTITGANLDVTITQDGNIADLLSGSLTITGGSLDTVLSHEALVTSNALTITGGSLDTVLSREALVTSNALTITGGDLNVNIPTTTTVDLLSNSIEITGGQLDIELVQTLHADLGPAQFLIIGGDLSVTGFVPKPKKNLDIEDLTQRHYGGNLGVYLPSSAYGIPGRYLTASHNHYIDTVGLTVTSAVAGTFVGPGCLLVPDPGEGPDIDDPVFYYPNNSTCYPSDYGDPEDIGEVFSVGGGWYNSVASDWILQVDSNREEWDWAGGNISDFGTDGSNGFSITDIGGAYYARSTVNPPTNSAGQVTYDDPGGYESLDADFKFQSVVGPASSITDMQAAGSIVDDGDTTLYVSLFISSSKVGYYTSGTGAKEYDDNQFLSTASSGGYSNAVCNLPQILSDANNEDRSISVVREGNYLNLFSTANQPGTTILSDSVKLLSIKFARHDRYVQATIPAIPLESLHPLRAQTSEGSKSNSDLGVRSLNLEAETPAFLKSYSFRDPCWRTIKFFLQADPTYANVVDHKQARPVIVERIGEGFHRDSSTVLYGNPTLKFVPESEPFEDKVDSIQKAFVVFNEEDNRLLTDDGDRTFETFFRLASGLEAPVSGDENYYLIGGGLSASGWKIRIVVESYNSGSNFYTAKFSLIINSIVQFSTSSVPVFLDTFHHFALVKDDSAYSIYFNGDRIGYNTSVTDTPTSGAVFIGQSNALAYTLEKSFHGWLQDIIWWETSKYTGASFTPRRYTLMQERYFEDPIGASPFDYGIGGDTDPGGIVNLPPVPETATYTLDVYPGELDLQKGVASLNYYRTLNAESGLLSLDIPSNGIEITQAPILYAQPLSISLTEEDVNLAQEKILYGTSTALTISTTPPAFNPVLFAQPLAITLDPTDSGTELEGIPLPVFTVQPVSLTVGENATAVFSGTATSDRPISYLWYNAVTVTPLPGRRYNSLTLDSVSLDRDGEQFFLRATNSEGYTDSNTVTLSVTLLPIITVQPSDVDVAEGATANFSVTATGADDYTWYPRHEAIPQEPLTDSYDINTTGKRDELDASEAFVIVSNAYGSVRSRAANLRVGVPPTITAHPQNVTTAENNLVTFSVTAYSVIGALTYQWRKDTVNIGGATDSTYTLQASAADTGAQFDVIVSNSYGQITSNAGTLTTEDADLRFGGPLLAGGLPQNIVAIQEDSGTETIQAFAEGTEPLSYQWYEIISGIDTILGGETTSSYDASIDALGLREYKLVVSDSGPSPDISATVRVTVIPGEVYTFTTEGFNSWSMCADKGFTTTETTNARIIEFGDGYSRRDRPKLVPHETVYNLAFNTRSLAEINDTKAFLDSKSGVEAFSLYVPTPLGAVSVSEVKVICEGYNVVYINDNYGSIDVRLRRVYETL